MAKLVTATDFLTDSSPAPLERVYVVFGDETFLRRHSLLKIRQAVLGEEDAELSLRVFNGPETELRDVLAELATRAMFGGGNRLAIVENADLSPGRSRKSEESSPSRDSEGESSDKSREGGASGKDDGKETPSFITRNRQALEDYVQRPSSSGVLVLEAAAFPSNTKLYKGVAERGMIVECRAPQDRPLVRWLRTWAKQTHAVDVAESAAETLVESFGAELGLIDQELAKLALLAGESRKVTAELVSANVGGSRLRQVWDMLDATMDGRSADALAQFDRLLASGDHPIALLAAISANLRRLAAATRIILGGEATGRRVSVREALIQTGVKPFVAEKCEKQLRRLGRHRGSQLYEWLLEADLALKGASSAPPRARMVIEQLLMRLSGEQAAPSKG